MVVLVDKMVNNGLYESISEGAKKILYVTVVGRTNTYDLVVLV